MKSKRSWRLKSGWVIQGKKVEDFEESFAEYCEVKYGVAVSNGTAALHIALAALDIKSGGEVITAPLLCVDTTNPIVYLNAKPVFVDVEPATLNLNPELIEKKITRKTKAVLHACMHYTRKNRVFKEENTLDTNINRRRGSNWYGHFFLNFLQTFSASSMAFT